MQYGAVDFLSKPIDTKELTECLQKLFCDYELALVKKLLLEEYQTLLTSIQQVDTQNQIIQQILEFVHQHYCMHFTISTIADNLGYSESYLYKVIKEDFPMTLNEYILRYRLKQAIDKIAESPIPLSDISEQVGFSDYKYFAKVFKSISIFLQN